MPRMFTKRPSPVSLDSEMPGIRPSASAALKSGYLAMVSADWTLIRLGAFNCSVRAATSSRGAVTMTSPLGLAGAANAELTATPLTEQSSPQQR